MGRFFKSFSPCPLRRHHTFHLQTGSDKLTKDSPRPSRRGDATINKQQQVKQGRRGKMSRGLSGRGPPRVQQHQRGYSLSFTPKTIVGSADNRIIDGSVCEHCPAVKFARPHRDPSTHQRQSLYIGPPYLYVRIFR